MSFWEKFDFIWNVTWNDFCAFIPAGQIPILATTLGIHYFSSFFQKKKKNKLTWAISCSNKSLMNLHHDAPNSHVLAINLTEFLVHVLSIASYIIADSESAKHAWKGHTLSIENFLYLLTK